MNKQLLLAIAISSGLLLGACSTTPSPMNAGQRISQRGGEISTYGDAWTAGRHDLEQGQGLVDKSSKKAADGEKDLVRAREQVAKAEAQILAAQTDRANGEQLMTDGTAQMRRAEANYSAVRTGPPAIVGTPEE